ncbi:TetR/AcrR family transcriptional regulator [Cytophagales bacterium LB-30]|uniref:TetR/AcrR family transcriptional regulator n=1 Tax=Shiella aurantiaca TaxID=3058365 RepID=A0ABT8F358_9BACT|nr:TetR/AcrR family transcriptional regulator [Shiella aurantiaca]MDN4164887.1 TetR/AcrR family transcriptional regulator [Shiella aurantiaca]
MQTVQENILEVALRLFIQYGVKSVTMDDLSKELGMSKKTIYQYYADKDEIVHLAVQQFLEAEEASFNAIRQKSSNTLEEIYWFSKHIKENMQKVNGSMIYDIKKHFPKTWRLFLEHKESFFKKEIVSTILRGKAEGYFREDVDPELMAILRLEQIEMCGDPEKFPSEKYSFTEVQQKFLMHFIHGMLTDKGRELLSTYFKQQ